MNFSIYNLNALYRWYKTGRYPDLQNALNRMEQELTDGHIISLKDMRENGISEELFRLYSVSELVTWKQKNLAGVACV